MTKIKLKAKQLEELSWEDDEDNPKRIKGYEGWTLDSDISKGEFDAEKGSMIDYKLKLTDPDGNEYIGYGGYYNAQCGEVYNYDVEFTLKQKKPKKSAKQKEEEQYKLYLKLKKKFEK